MSKNNQNSSYQHTEDSHEVSNFNLNKTVDITVGSAKQTRSEHINSKQLTSTEIDEQRSPMITSPGSQGYNRYKYYSALRTGYK